MTKRKTFALVSLLVGKNTPVHKFQSIRKEDLYKKGIKGKNINYIFLIGTLLMENAKKIKIKTKVSFFNLNLRLSINKLSSNLLNIKEVKYKNNVKWRSLQKSTAL
jgi:hypothetical protein